MTYLDKKPAQRSVNVPTAAHHWPESRIFPVKATFTTCCERKRSLKNLQKKQNKQKQNMNNVWDHKWIKTLSVVMSQGILGFISGFCFSRTAIYHTPSLLKETKTSPFT